MSFENGSRGQKDRENQVVYFFSLFPGLQMATTYTLTLSYLDEAKSSEPIAIESIPLKTNECKYFLTLCISFENRF